MPTYQELLPQLLTIEKQAHEDKNKSLLSIYLPMRDELRSDVKRDTYVKSEITEAFRNSQELSEDHLIHQDFVQQIKEKIFSDLEFIEGLGVFALVEKRNYMRKPIQNDEYFLVDFHHQPEKQSHLGNNFRLSQLLWAMEYDIPTLVLNISQEQAEIYSLRGRTLKKHKVVKNPQDYQQEQEYIERFSPKHGGGMHYGTGGNKLAHKKTELDKRFADDVIDYLTSLKDDVSRFERVLIWGAAKLKEPFSRLTKTISETWHIDPIWHGENQQDFEKLREESWQVVSQLRQDNKKQELTDAKSNFRLFAEGWKEVCDAAQKHNIDTLFLEPNLQQEGYILNEELPYTHPRKDTEKVPNLVPWIARLVINTDGSISTFVDMDLAVKEGIAAKLRFEPAN